MLRASALRCYEGSALSQSALDNGVPHPNPDPDLPLDFDLDLNLDDRDAEAEGELEAHLVDTTVGWELEDTHTRPQPRAYMRVQMDEHISSTFEGQRSAAAQRTLHLHEVGTIPRKVLVRAFEVRDGELLVLLLGVIVDLMDPECTTAPSAVSVQLVE